MRHFAIPLLLLFGTCSCVDMPSRPRAAGRIAVEAVFAPAAAAKLMSVQYVSSMEIGVYQGNEVVTSGELRRVGSRWQGDVKVDAGSYWVKLAARKGNVDWIGAAFATVEAGKVCRPQIHMVSSIAPLVKGNRSQLLDSKFCPNCDLRGGVDLSGATLPGALLTGAILAEAEMRGAYLSGVDFSHAYLIDIKLDDADLSGAELSGTNLSEANMNRINLTGANLTDADLFRAELEEAILVDADLTGANLVSAYLKGAKLDGAVLLGANLSGATWFDGRVCGDNSIVRGDERNIGEACR